MKIISFTGKSGTGKSYHATEIAQSRGINAIIDDGLLIYKGQIVAGSSAKKCKTKAAAMRTALFNYEDKRREVINAIVKYHPESLLILGTSDRMTDIIAETLGLHIPDERLYVEDYTTPEEREIAQYSRGTLGEHVIPAPMGQLKRDFSGYFMNPIKFIRDKALGTAVKNETEEGDSNDRTVVRPQYSYFGAFTISERVLRDIIEITSDDFSEGLSVMDCLDNGKQNRMTITIDVRIVKNSTAVDTCIAFQKAVHGAIENMTSFVIDNINIRIRDYE